MQISKFFCLLILSAFCLLGCQTHPYMISENLLSAREHRKIITTVIGDVRVVSQNGRELYSHFHDKKFKFIDEPTKVQLRYFTKVAILGIRRPYDITVEVIEERKDPEIGVYVEQGLDEGLTQIRFLEIKKLLNQSRANPQEFDVENPF